MWYVEIIYVICCYCFVVVQRQNDLYKRILHLLSMHTPLLDTILTTTKTWIVFWSLPPPPPPLRIKGTYYFATSIYSIYLFDSYIRKYLMRIKIYVEPVEVILHKCASNRRLWFGLVWKQRRLYFLARYTATLKRTQSRYLPNDYICADIDSDQIKSPSPSVYPKSPYKLPYFLRAYRLWKCTVSY